MLQDTHRIHFCPHPSFKEAGHSYLYITSEVLRESSGTMFQFLSVQDMNPDVLLLQETEDPSQLAYIVDNYPYTLFLSYFGGFGNVICSKIPLVDTTKLVFSTNDRVILGATLEGLNIRVYCTHLDVFDESGYQRAVQIEESKMLLGFLSLSSICFVVCWDDCIFVL